MEQTPKKRAYTKSRLIKELAFRAGISQHQSRAALEAIIEIAYREAKANYFILPGLCKFDVARRALRHVRNPSTGEKLVLPERDSLRVVLSKRAKETVTPRVAPLTEAEYAAVVAQKAAEEAARKAAEEEAARKAAEAASVAVAEPERPVEEPPPASMPEPAPTSAPESAAVPAPKVAVAPEPEPKPAPEPSPQSVAEPELAAGKDEKKPAEDGFIEAPEIQGDRAISFKCTTCGQEIIAPEETAGYEAECPACGAILLVPSKSEPGTTYANEGGTEQKTIVSAREIEDLDPAQLKNRTIRIDALFGDENEKPSVDDRLANAMKSSTMRIDLPDEF